MRTDGARIQVPSGSAESRRAETRSGDWRRRTRAHGAGPSGDARDAPRRCAAGRRDRAPRTGTGRSLGRSHRRRSRPSDAAGASIRSEARGPSRRAAVALRPARGCDASPRPRAANRARARRRDQPPRRRSRSPQRSSRARAPADAQRRVGGGPNGRQRGLMRDGRRRARRSRRLDRPAVQPAPALRRHRRQPRLARWRSSRRRRCRRASRALPADGGAQGGAPVRRAGGGRTEGQ